MFFKGGEHHGRSLLCEMQGEEGNGQCAGSDDEEWPSRDAGCVPIVRDEAVPNSGCQEVAKEYRDLDPLAGPRAGEGGFSQRTVETES